MIKKGKQVEILCGKDKGKKGEIIEILRSQSKVKVKELFTSSFNTFIHCLYNWLFYI